MYLKLRKDQGILMQARFECKLQHDKATGVDLARMVFRNFILMASTIKMCILEGLRF